MGVYIRNIEMPKNCGDCPCASIFAGYKCMTCGKQFDKYPFENRMDWCPLISVPPHGRLGDLDELHKEAVRRAEKAGSYDSWYNSVEHVISAFDIERAPTIIKADESGMDSFIHIFEEDDEEDGMDSFIRILKD